MGRKIPSNLLFPSNASLPCITLWLTRTAISPTGIERRDRRDSRDSRDRRDRRERRETWWKRVEIVGIDGTDRSIVLVSCRYIDI